MLCLELLIFWRIGGLEGSTDVYNNQLRQRNTNMTRGTMLKYWFELRAKSSQLFNPFIGLTIIGIIYTYFDIVYTVWTPLAVVMGQYLGVRAMEFMADYLLNTKFARRD